MTTILHVIPVLSTGGAARALVATAKYSSRQGPFIHRVISLRTGAPESLDLAMSAGLTVLQAPDRTTVVQEMMAADVVQVDWWNDPQLQSLLHGDLPPLRLLLWYHVAGNSAPQIITADLVNFTDLNVPTNPWSYRELAVFRDMPAADRDQRVAMVIDGADFERVQGVEPRPHEHFNIGYIGTVDFVKMHRNFVPMSTAISIPEARFIVCGHGIEARLREQAGRLGAAERFDFRGYVSDLKPVIEILDVYGYPLCEDTYASGELNLQEVMYAGVAPVVFPHGGVKGLVEDNKTGLVVAGEAEYRQAIEFLYHHPDERTRLGRAAREYAREHFGAENAARLLNPLYERLMRSPKRLRSWGCPPDRPLLEQPVSLLDVVEMPDSGVGARLFVESLGDAGQDFLTSLTALDPPALWAAEEAIAHASPLLGSVAAGGILHYRNAFPDDGFLRFWSGLVLHQEGKFAEAVVEFRLAVDRGCDHWRVGWYIDQATRQIGESTLADQGARGSLQAVSPAGTVASLALDRIDGGHTDASGRRWFKVPASGTDGSDTPGQSEDWVYDPDNSQLRKATSDERVGEAILTPKPEVTAESLGLEPGAEVIGRDPFGRCWFKVPGPERRVYDAERRQLYRAIQQADGKWTLEKIASLLR